MMPRYRPPRVSWFHPFYASPAMIVLLLGLNRVTYGAFHPNVVLGAGVIIQLLYLRVAYRSRRCMLDFYRRLNAAETAEDFAALWREAKK